MRFKVLILAFLCFSTGIYAQCNKMPKWLLGTWAIENQAGVSFEQWTNIGDTIYSGRTFGLYGKDTLLFDEMAIKCIDGKPVYFMYGSVKNNRVFAGFKLTEQSDANTLFFSNEGVDFPHEFCYNRADKNTVYVWFHSANPDEACTDFKMTRTSH